MQELQIRKSLPSDKNFILSSWLKSYKNMSGFAKRIPMAVYTQYHSMIVENILQKPHTEVMVACPDPDDLDEIAGYLVLSKLRAPAEDLADFTIQYLFVKKEFQGQGIAKALISNQNIRDQDRICFTHWTYPMDEITKKYPQLIYHPYRI